VSGDPGYRTAFERKAAADREKVFEKPGGLVGSMGMQAMIAQTDAEAGGHPIQENRDRQIAPTEHKERREGAQMEQDHGDRGGPIQPLVLSNLKNLATHLSPIMLVIPT
jgi:hypothetical protein